MTNLSMHNPTPGQNFRRKKCNWCNAKPYFKLLQSICVSNYNIAFETQLTELRHTGQVGSPAYGEGVDKIYCRPKYEEWRPNVNFGQHVNGFRPPFLLSSSLEVQYALSLSLLSGVLLYYAV